MFPDRGAALLVCFLSIGCRDDVEAPVFAPAGHCPGIQLPEDEYYAAPGLCAAAVATRQGSLRQLTFASNGDLLGVTLQGSIRRYRDTDGDGVFDGADEIVELGRTGGDNGNNVHLDEAAGFLYAGTPEGVRRWRYQASESALGPAEQVVVDQPSTGTHRLHTVHVYDGWLYVHSGSENNAVAPLSPEYDTERAVLKRFALDELDPGAPFRWSEGEVFVRGIRNMVGFTRGSDGELYGVVNGIDHLVYGGEDVHRDNPGEDVIRLRRGGRHGYPYCFTAQDIADAEGRVPPGTQLVTSVDNSRSDPDFVNPHDRRWCEENSEPPLTFTQAHSAPLEIAFFDGPSGELPERWRGGAFVALHGSWNRQPSTGHQVVLIPFDQSGSPPMPEPSELDGVSFPFEIVFGGGNRRVHADGRWGWSTGEHGEDPVRPVGLAVSPLDGSLFVSSDNAGEELPQGAIYRIALGR